MNKDFNYRYKRIINPIIAGYYYNFGKWLYKKGHKAKGMSALLNSFWFSPRVFKNMVVSSAQ